MKYYWKSAEVYPVPGQTYSTHWNCYYDQPTENGGHRRIIISIVPEELRTDEVVVREEKKELATSFNINLASYTTIRDALGTGIGRTAPRAFIKNRPEDGYTDFAQFKKLNESLENINWEEIEKIIVFE